MIEVESTSDLTKLVAETSKRKSKPLLILFGGSWCAPCKSYKPMVTNVTAAYEDRIVTAYFDLDKGPAPGPFPIIRGIPALVMVKRGKTVDHAEGAMPMDALREWLRHAMRAVKGGRKRK